MAKQSIKPGAHWRLSAGGDKPGTRINVEAGDGTIKTLGLTRHVKSEVVLKGNQIFDEIVVDDWLHVEQMSERHWWAQVGDARVEITIDRRGQVTTSICRGEYKVCKCKGKCTIHIVEDK